MGALLFVFVEAICSEAFLDRFIIFLTVVLNIKQPMLSCLICQFSCRRPELKIDLCDLLQPQTCGMPEQAYTKVCTVGYDKRKMFVLNSTVTTRIWAF